jgi:hypothetical protein
MIAVFLISQSEGVQVGILCPIAILAKDEP